MERQPRIALCLKEKEVQEKKGKRLEEIKTIIAKGKAKQPIKDTTSKQQNSTESHKSTTPKKCVKQTKQEAEIVESDRRQGASMKILKKQSRIPGKKHNASINILKKQSQIPASNSLINNTECGSKSPLILPPKKRRDNALYKANDKVLNNDGSKTNDFHIRACASLKATLSLEVAEEEKKKKRLAEVKEMIVGIFHRKRVEYLSIDLLF